MSAGSPGDVLAIALTSATIGAVLAWYKGLSIWVWCVVCLMVPGFGLLLLFSRPSLRLKCSRCGNTVRVGDAACTSCGGPVPDNAAAVVTLNKNTRYRQQCPSCGLPYNDSDYSPTAENRLCSGCKSELPSLS